jgi:orotate phosphoribosyltransferase
MAEMLADYIKASSQMGDVTHIAGPKAGNIILVHETSRRLGMNSLFVRNNILFGKWIEGFAGPGQKVILVDDVASDGEMLREAVINLRKCGVYTGKVCVLVDREEGDAKGRLAQEGVEYKYLFKLGDRELEEIHRCGRQ